MKIILYNTICCLAALQDFPPKSGKMVYRSDMERVALCVVYCLHIFLALPWQAAYDAARCHKALENYLPEGDMSEADQQEARRAGKKFIGDATVKNLPHTKHLNTHTLLQAIPPDEAKMASFILKTGYTESFPLPDGEVHTEHNYYTTLGDALDHSPALNGIYLKYKAMFEDLTHAEFMRALYKYDPLLRERRVHIKYALDDELKDQRLHKARYFYGKANSDPNWLKRIFFVDECAINFDHEIRKGVHVYCDAHDKGYRFVIPFEKLQPNKGIKVKVMGAVNMLTGPIFLEFTTGTTDVQRTHNVNSDGTQRQYKVSVCYNLLLLAKDNNAPVQVCRLCFWQHASQHLHICLHVPCLIYVHSAVSWAEHNAQSASSNVAGSSQKPGAQPALQVQLVHSDHTYTRLYSLHTTAHISIQHSPAASVKGILEVGRPVSLHNCFFADVQKINRRWPEVGD
jgi:hypothetical protein